VLLHSLISFDSTEKSDELKAGQKYLFIIIYFVSNRRDDVTGKYFGTNFGK